MEESISMIERTSMKLYPVVKEVLKRMIEETPGESNSLLQKDIQYDKIIISEDADMRSVLGFLNQNEWVYSLNIGNIMQI
jgi:hypothetical protein